MPVAEKAEHRDAAERLGYRKVPVIIRTMKDDKAVVSMIDSNLQRERTLLISIVGFMLLYKISQPMNTLLTIILIGNMVAVVLTGGFLNHLS